jgi:hypothetical protein
MQPDPITTKTESLYRACSPELDVVSYGACREEAINALADEIRPQREAGSADDPLTTAADPGPHAPSSGWGSSGHKF